MGTGDEYSSLDTQNQTELQSSKLNNETCFSDHNPETETEQAVVEGFQNVGLKENESENYSEERYGDDPEGEANDAKYQHPLRPYAEDCPFYIRTGKCKFGFHCWFNHPVGRAHQENEKERGGIVERTKQIECKYYLTAGGCKFGQACRYNHSEKKSGRYKEKSEIATPELNFLGLPIRMLEKECPFYMRTGSCRYGVDCRFHHPDPTDAGGSNHFNPTPTGVSAKGHSSGNFTGEYDPLQSLGASGPAASSWSSHMTLNKAVPYVDSQSSYSPGMHLNPEWSRNQASTYPQGWTRHSHSAPTIGNLRNTADISTFHQQQIQVDEFPERPGQPDCEYFLRSGDCQYRSVCKFNHPKSRLAKSPGVTLSDPGLPARPERKLCQNYERYGSCRFGQYCFFDHPENYSSSAFRAEPVPGSPPGSNWRD